MKVGEFMVGLDKEAPVVKSGRVIYCPECHAMLTELQAFGPSWERDDLNRRVLSDLATATVGKRVGELTLKRSVGRGGPLLTACCLRSPAYGVMIVSGSHETWQERMD